jgi:hypothetical protein
MKTLGSPIKRHLEVFWSIRFIWSIILVKGEMGKVYLVYLAYHQNADCGIRNAECKSSNQKASIKSIWSVIFRYALGDVLN